MILHALHNICTRKKRGKSLLFKAKLRSCFTLSWALYESCLACQHFTVPFKSKLTGCCESQFLLDSRFLIPVHIENRVEDQVSWDRKQKFDPWLPDFLIISHRHNTTQHGLFVWATRIETRPSKANFSSCTYQASFPQIQFQEPPRNANKQLWAYLATGPW